MLGIRLPEAVVRERGERDNTTTKNASRTI
jgi:hypothetical protein